jgi:hypothetical protein
MSEEIRAAGIPKESMPTGKFLRHAGLVPDGVAAMLVKIGALVRVNDRGDPGQVRIGDVVTLAQLPSDGGSTSWEPEDVTRVRVVRA